ncbi:uncharacterized protein LY89DRAFT_691621 [Mollisia scopiformis]|uniref:Uncharacterized protein n=1 Tax=Mollisia scopiformis TaxID=149040 RepID=A0A132B5K8_MOLSC|nr:uncharacterized protein LY89DRAFT_691621 [Mollisia scopiformis]KUJ07533.1 hypothetical protein LY89DRAFT_691621 [Mollisia scopiformis]
MLPRNRVGSKPPEFRVLATNLVHQSDVLSNRPRVSWVLAVLPAVIHADVLECWSSEKAAQTPEVVGLSSTTKSRIIQFQKCASVQPSNKIRKQGGLHGRKNEFLFAFMINKAISEVSRVECQEVFLNVEDLAICTDENLNRWTEWHNFGCGAPQQFELYVALALDLAFMVLSTVACEPRSLRSLAFLTCLKTH